MTATTLSTEFVPGLAGVVAQRKVAARKGVNRQIWQGARKEIVVAVQVEIFAQSNHV